MNIDKALANCKFYKNLRRGGDTSKGRVEHRSILQLNIIHQTHDTGQNKVSYLLYLEDEVFGGTLLRIR